MASWITLGYTLNLRAIVAAYRKSRDAFMEEMRLIEEECEQYTSSFADTSDEDYGYRDHLSDQAFNAENGLRLIREAFALTLYHFWEKEMCGLLGLNNANYKKMVDNINADGRISMDVAGVNRLRLIANTIKHGNGYPLYQVHPTLFAPEAGDLTKDESTRWHLLLRLDEADIEMAISAIETSGPGSKWDDGSIEDD